MTSGEIDAVLALLRTAGVKDQTVDYVRTALGYHDQGRPGWCPVCSTLMWTQIPRRHVWRNFFWFCPAHDPMRKS